MQERTTEYTVEAISVPNQPQNWIGINHLKYKECMTFFSPSLYSYSNFFFLVLDVGKFLRNNQLEACIKVTIDDKFTRYHSSKHSGADFVLNDNIAIQVRMPLIVLYDSEALSTLSDAPKKRQATTLDKWLQPAKKARAEGEPDEPVYKDINGEVKDAILQNKYSRVIVLLCFIYDAPILDPKGTHFPQQMVANAGRPVWFFFWLLYSINVSLITGCWGLAAESHFDGKLYSSSKARLFAAVMKQVSQSC